MKKISANSKAKVFRLLCPPTKKTGVDFRAPRGLTVRRLMRWEKFRKLREQVTFAEIEGGHLVSIENLALLGFDMIG